ncbi:MAG: hypothetical protein EOP00_23185 [Pedobacter sp.]|nr:MAG: hypothetical protein EOP00_23185 [Pedobacter sp.]
MPLEQNAIIAIFTISTLLSCGALLDHKNWLKYFEYARLLLSIVALYFFKELPIFKALAISLVITQIISFFWFYYIDKQALNVKEVSRV